jgi:hypothetical protein
MMIAYVAATLLAGGIVWGVLGLLLEENVDTGLCESAEEHSRKNAA